MKDTTKQIEDEVIKVAILAVLIAIALVLRLIIIIYLIINYPVIGLTLFALNWIIRKYDQA